VKLRAVQIVSIVAILFVPTMSILAQPTVGQTYHLNLTDVDGNSFSTTEARTTILVLSMTSNSDKARLVGERTPDLCLGNPNFRMITVVEFQKQHSAPMRAFLKSIIRHRLDAEGERLQKRYEQLKISHTARKDVFAVADFDNAIATQLGLKPDATFFRTLIFGKGGELVKQWSDVPTAEELSAVLK
jgi:hypothetical protein